MSRALDRLRTVVSRLRGPKGCPWDREQTFASLIPFVREESAELVQAIRRGRWPEIEDELGDILFHVMLIAKVAEQKGLFGLDDVARAQALKLVRRHPHVFGDRRFKTAAEVLRHWDEVKSEERRLRRQDLARRTRSAKRRR